MIRVQQTDERRRAELEASAEEMPDPSRLLSALAANGSLDRSVELATDLLAEEAA